MIKEAKEEFVVTHGSFKTPDGTVELGESISVTPSEAKKIDPTGVSLKLKTIWDADQKGAKAGAAAKAEALADAEKAKAAAAHKEKAK